MIDHDSRYAATPIRDVELDDGGTARLLAPRRTPATQGFLQVFVAPGDRLDQLANDYYGEATEFWRICDASEHLDPFDVLVPGRPLMIPPAP